MALYIDIHTHRAEPDGIAIRNVRIESSVPQLPATGYFSAGIHPWDASRAQPEWERCFETPSPRLLAIGEAGLDFRPEYRPYDLQERWFERQIDVSNRLRKPLIIHNVHATDALLKRLQVRAQEAAVLHNFIGSPELVAQSLGRVPHLRFSFGPGTFRSPKTQQALRYIAERWPDRLFLETDDDPTTAIGEMYARTSRLLGWELSALQESLARNFHLLFPKISLG